jgi:hypothetical protein
MIVGGHRDPNDVWDDEMRRQYHISFENEAVLAKNFLRDGFDVVIDDVIRKGALYDEWKRHFDGTDHRVVLLLPSLDAALERNLNRSEKTVPQKTLRDLHAKYQELDHTGWIVIDNSDQTPEDTVATIRQQLSL